MCKNLNLQSINKNGLSVSNVDSTNIQINSSEIELQKKDSIKIAFRLNGNLGSILCRTNYVKAFVDKFSSLNIFVTVYGHPKLAINEAIFDGLGFVNSYKSYTMLKKENYKLYDLVIDVDTFPSVIHCDSSFISNFRNLSDYLKKLQDHKNVHSKWYEKFSEYRAQIYKIAVINGKNCISNEDIGGLLNQDNDYLFSLNVKRSFNEISSKFGIRQPYITLNRGSYTIPGQSEGTRVWPLNAYNDLINIIKNNYPEFQIIQIGESNSCTPLNNTDLNLSGLTDLEELKCLLLYSYLHVDGEGGMVHLRRAVNGGASVVVFGATPLEYFGLNGNINIKSDVCRESCCELFKHWIKICYKSKSTPLCLESISAESVFGYIKSYKEKKEIKSNLNFSSSLYKGTLDFINDERFVLDPYFVEDFVSKVEIYCYFFEEITINNLVCKYFTENKSFKKISIKDSKCNDFIRGNKLSYQKYNEFKDLNAQPDKYYNNERFECLLTKLNDEGFDVRFPIIVNGENCILDGEHRACFLLNKFGANYRIKVLKVYGSFNF